MRPLPVVAAIVGLAVAGEGPPERIDSAPAPGDGWTEAGTGMRFRYVPPGTFTRGSPGDEPGRDDDEVQHEVTLSQGFWLGETEVTQDEWRRITGRSPSLLSGCGGECPVERVSWFDAVTFANRMSEEAGRTSCYVLEGCGGGFSEGCEAEAETASDWCRGDYACRSVGYEPNCDGFRLPTEAEWEHAARAGTTTATYDGDVTLRRLNDGPELDRIGWYAGNSGVAYENAWDCSDWSERQFPAKRCGTHPVGLKEPNAWGLHDMIGNVWEWVWDWKGPYPATAVTDPKGPPFGTYRVRRGCCWSNIPDHCRAADRSDDEPILRDRNWGVRLAFSSPPKNARAGPTDDS